MGLNAASALGVTRLVKRVPMAIGIEGVGVMDTVGVMVGVKVMVGVRVIVGVFVMVGVRVIVGEGG